MKKILFLLAPLSVLLMKHQIIAQSAEDRGLAEGLLGVELSKRKKQKEVCTRFEDDPAIQWEWAISTNNVKCVQVLIENGFDVNKQLKQFRGESPLDVAIRRCLAPMAKELIAQGAHVGARELQAVANLMRTKDHNRPTTYTNCSNDDLIDITKDILDKKPDLDISEVIDFMKSGDRYLYTFNPCYRARLLEVLRTAKKGNHLAIKEIENTMKYVVYYYGDNSCFSRAPLITPQWTELVDELIAIGKGVNMVDQEGKSALMRAAEQPNIEKIKKLLAVGADVNLVNNYGRTALMILVAALERTLFYCEQEADDDARHADLGKEATILKQAIRLLEDHGARLPPISTSAKTFLTYDTDCAIGYNVNAVDQKGRSALRVTAELGPDIEKMKKLLAAGADVNLADNNGKTALMVFVDTLEKTFSDYEKIKPGDDSHQAYFRRDATRLKQAIRLLEDHGAHLPPLFPMSTSVKAFLKCEKDCI